MKITPRDIATIRARHQQNQQILRDLPTVKHIVGQKLVLTTVNLCNYDVNVYIQALDDEGTGNPGV